MSIYQPKGSKTWTMDFHFHGQRIRESTGTRSKTLAGKIEDKRRRDLEAGAAGIASKQNRPLLFPAAADEYQQMKEARWAPKTRIIAESAKAHLLPAFGKRLLVDIEGSDIRRYQNNRKAAGAAPRTVNIEVGFLRAVMRRFGAWPRIQHQVTMLPEQGDIGRALAADEESRLLRECGNSSSRALFQFTVLAIETGARKNTIRTLLWRWIDFEDQCIQFGKDKTQAGSGRIIPLSRHALEVLKFWAQQFPNREDEHFVFPAERYGAAGNVFESKAYATDPTEAIASIKEAWEAAKKRAGVKCRFHDLRHTAVSRMLDAGTPINKVARIVGWSPATMVRMSARYGHFTLEDLRSAVETITRPGTCGVEEGYPRNPPQSDTENRGHRAN